MSVTCQCMRMPCTSHYSHGNLLTRRSLSINYSHGNLLTRRSFSIDYSHGNLLTRRSSINRLFHAIPMEFPVTRHYSHGIQSTNNERYCQWMSCYSHAYVWLGLCVCMCVCVCIRESVWVRAQRAPKIMGSKIDPKILRCVCMCVCVRMRESVCADRSKDVQICIDPR